MKTGIRGIQMLGMIALACISFGIAGCGGGGGGAAAVVVSGTVSKGLIKNGTVVIYSVTAAGVKGNLLKQTTTDANGKYSVDISPYTGPVVIEAYGSYTDEATGALVTLLPSQALRAVCANASGNVNIAVTDLTDMAARLMSNYLPATINAANQKVIDTFHVDILNVQPVAPLAAVMYNGTTTQAQRDYTLALAALSQMAGTLATPVATLAADLSAGTMSAGNVTLFQSSLTTYLGGSNNTTGATSSGTNLGMMGSSAKTLAFSSSGSSLIGSTEAVVTLPAGVTVPQDFANGQVLAEALLKGSSAPGSALLTGKYTAGTPSNVKLALAGTTAFGSGEFALLTVYVPSGSSLTSASFPLSAVKFFDGNGVLLTGVSMGVAYR